MTERLLQYGGSNFGHEPECFTSSALEEDGIWKSETRTLGGEVGEKGGVQLPVG